MKEIIFVDCIFSKFSISIISIASSLLGFIFGMGGVGPDADLRMRRKRRNTTTTIFQVLVVTRGCGRGLRGQDLISYHDLLCNLLFP